MADKAESTSTPLNCSYDSEDTNKNPSTIQDPENLPQVVLQDIRLSMAAKRQRKKQCLFFHIVSGGNVNMVHNILKFLDESGHSEELHWILNRNEDDDDSEQAPECMRRLFRAIMFLISLASFVVMTPLFYLLHAVGIGLYSAMRRIISEDPQLPLLFALKSKRPEMIIMFLEVGVTLDDVDEDDNNIYHYLSDLSAADPEEAILYHRILMECVKDMEQMRDVILHQENRIGLTPLEFCLRWGSMKFAEHLFLEKGLMRETLVSVNDSSIHIDEHYLSKMSSRKYVIAMIPSRFPVNHQRHGKEHPSTQDQSNLEIAEYNLHRYENGDALGRQSYLLHLVASRKVEVMTPEDIDSFININFLHSWIKRKKRRFIFPCVVSHVLQVLITVLLLLYLLHFGGDMNPFPLLEKLVDNYLTVSLQLMFESWDWSLSKSLNKTKGAPVTNISPTVVYQSNGASATSYFTMEDLDNLRMDDLTTLCYNKTETIGGHVLNQCLSKALAIVMEECNGLSLEEALEYSGVKLFLESAPYEGMALSRIMALLLESFMICHMFLDLIYRIMFLIRNFKTTSTFPYVTGLPMITRRFPGSYIEKQLILFMYGLFTVYLVIFWRLEYQLKTYLVTAFREDLQSTLSGIHHDVNAVTAQQTSAYTLDADIHIQLTKERLLQGIAQIEKSSFVTQEFVPMLNDNLRVMSYLLILCLIMRFLLAIHVMRLLPGVGFFVITARKMAQHLIEFVLVFLLVAVAFATIFYFVMRDPECPANKVEGFHGMVEGLFSTYLIALGQGEFEFFKNTNAQVAFVVYTVLTTLLLFNLIIAVMSTTADALNQKSRRKALCILETWDETLGVEATCQTLNLPFDCCVALGKCFINMFISLRKNKKDDYDYHGQELPTLTVNQTTVC